MRDELAFKEVRAKLPKELEPLREWLAARNPFPTLALEDVLNDSTPVMINAPRALIATEFQGGVHMLAAALASGRVKLAPKKRVRRD